MGYARQRITRTVVVTRNRTRTGSRATTTSADRKGRRTSRRCPSCGRYI